VRWKLSNSNYPLLTIAVFAAGLVLAGGLLYRWINRASVADREQQEEYLNAAMRSFRGEFMAPLLEIRASFRPMPGATTTAALDDDLAAFYSQWRSNDSNGALVSGLSVATLDADGKLRYRTLDAATGKFRQEPWPASFEMFRPRIERFQTHGSGRVVFFRTNGFPFAVNGDRPVIVVPLVESGGRGRRFGMGFHTRGRPGPGPMPEMFTEREEHGPGPQPPEAGSLPERAVRPPLPGRLHGWCFLELNLDYLKQHVLPELVERNFGEAGLSSYRVGVLAGHPREIVFASEPGLEPSSFTSPDGDARLLAPFGGMRGLLRARARRLSRRTRTEGDIGVSITGGPPRAPGTASPAGPGGRAFGEGSAWILVVKSKAGSIDALVARTRRRNLALGFGVLFLLAFSMGSLVITTHRARQLARREMEFVAGVSHEIRTPLASIQSAGYNLSSGVVQDAGRVKEYGSLVQKEARRLTDMIEQVMSYAGIQSGAKRYELAPIEVPAMVERVLAEYGPALRDAGWRVEKNVEENLPNVLAEASSVESAVKNLFANAIKYGEANRWLRITAACAPNGGRKEVQISVEDRGPGIDPADLPHIFEPFYRAQGVLASTVPGAGLGLSIVKRHIEAQGGRVSVESAKGKGSRFTLHLPAVSEPEHRAG
jgi:signal transduction histidine kinase